MGTEFRIFQRLIIETINNIKRSNWMNIVIITTMAAILSIFGCMFRVTLGLDNFVKQIGSTLQISVYLKDQTDSKAFLEKVKAMPDISEIEFISKDKAWEDLKKQYSVVDISNPLPDTIHLRVKKADYIEQTVENLKQYQEVENVYFPEMISQQMRKIARTTTIVTVILVILLGGMTIFIISNTIQLLIQSCSKEIDIMSMMGVSSWYIKTPYILQGTFYGLSGAIIALLPLYFVQGYILKIYQYFNSVPPPLNMNVVILAILGMGIIVGASGSLISVQKHLKI
jgi:cell division transport system permease protein